MSKAEGRISGTKEWATHNVNCCLGCSHGCLYCYGRTNAMRFGRIRSGEDWTTERINQKAMDKNHHKYDGTVMFPTTHDITPTNIDACIVVLRKLLIAGNRVLIVSKPHEEIIKLLCSIFQDYKKQILFRFTIGSVSKNITSFWEPGAPSFSERLASLYTAYLKEFATSVSCEPLLEPQKISVLIKALEVCTTDTIWIGAANHLRQRTAWKLQACHPEILKLEARQTPQQMREIYNQLKGNPKIRWKDSYKKILGLEQPKQAGLDI